jgi:hypothetical protein
MLWEPLERAKQGVPYSNVRVMHIVLVTYSVENVGPTRLPTCGRWPDMGTPEMHLTMCDLCVIHFMCARNSLFNTMYTTIAMPSITPSNFCNFSIFFSDQKNIFQKSHYFGRGYPYQAIVLAHNSSKPSLPPSMNLELFTSRCTFLGNSRHYMDSCSNANSLNTLCGFDRVTNPYEETRFLPCPKICEKVWHRRSCFGLRWDRTFRSVSTSLPTERKLRTLLANSSSNFLHSVGFNSKGSASSIVL